MKHPDAKLIIFARAPVPGQVKTRLVPALGETGAAAFYARMARYVIARMLDSQLCDMSIDCMPDSNHVFFLGLLEQRCVELNRQTGSDLGARMAHALENALQHHDYAVLIGSDAPGLDPAYVENAIEALKSGVKLVMGPAQDGGYVLIGMNVFHGELFKAIDWGTSQVLQQTLDKARQLNLSVHQLPALWDVDTPADLEKVRGDARLAFLLESP
jgi:hypothetical protein